MASEVEICNLSLSNIGEEANIQSIAPPDASVAAEKCAQFYPIARDELQAAHAWSFNTGRQVLATTTNPSTMWQFAYSLPTDCLKPLAVYPYGASDDTQSEDFVVESAADGSPIVYTNTQLAELKYQRRVVTTVRFTPQFVVVLARKLSVFLAGAIIKGRAGTAVANEQARIFVGEWAVATASDANASQLIQARTQRIPSHLAVR